MIGRNPRSDSLCAIVCVCAAWLTTPGATTADQPEGSANGQVLLNDSFETGDEAPTGWKTLNSSVAKLVWESGVASDGKRSVGIHKSEQRFFPIASWSRIVEHRTQAAGLQITVQVKTENVQKAVVDALFLGADGKPIKHEWVSYIGSKERGQPPANHDWKPYRGVVEIPPLTKKIALQLQMYGPGQIWFDELQAAYVPTSELKSARSDVAETTPEKAAPASDATAKAHSVVIREGASAEYLLVEPDDQKNPPEDGYDLLVVLPGGSGSADFHPFVRSIGANALADNWLVAQPLAVRWIPSQEIVWPTTRSKVPKMRFTTEEFVAKVIENVAAKRKVRRDGVFLLAWSSGGPAAYATLLQKESPVAGALIAMSVFKPNLLPDPANARGRACYLLHSPEDRVTPYAMAKTAKDSLEKKGMHVHLTDYAGGHGWQGDVFGNIRAGIDWLKAHARPARE